MKLWDLKSWHCVDTVICHRSEVWALDIHPDGQYIFTGSADGEVKGWRIDYDNVSSSLEVEGDVTIKVGSF